MQTAEEMQAAGLKREVKMMALAHMRTMTNELGVVLVSDNEITMAGHAADFVVALTQRIEELDAENHASFEAFIGAQREVDQLEALLQAGGEELECKLCNGDEAAELALDARMERDQERRENRDAS